jgi:hypothetical protein
MDIAPISAIRPVTMVKPSPAAPDLSRVFEVEYLGQSRDDQYTPANKKAARGLEDEEDKVTAEEPAGREAPETAVDSGKVSLFA